MYMAASDIWWINMETTMLDHSMNISVWGPIILHELHPLVYIYIYIYIYMGQYFKSVHFAVTAKDSVPLTHFLTLI